MFSWNHLRNRKRILRLAARQKQAQCEKPIPEKGSILLFLPPSRDAEPSAFVIWLLRFMISSLAKKLVLECFYRVWQNLTSQELNRVTPGYFTRGFLHSIFHSLRHPVYQIAYELVE